MASDFPILSLDLRPPTSSPAISSSFSDVLTRFLVTGIDNSGELSKLSDFVVGLEDELKKIQAFQRELPLSFLLLNDAISKLKEAVKKDEEKRWDGNFGGPIGVKLGIDHEFEKKTWMSSAQLWSPTNGEGNKNEERGLNLSFQEATDDVSGLSLVPPGAMAVEKPGTGGIYSGSVFSTGENQRDKPEMKSAYQAARKRRRCWSPELHRRFVDALEQLGGSQVATPKQIRELMQVDGLTNDEVKSHLQKYRLHTRRPSSGVHNNANQQQAPQFVVVGGIWMPPQEYAAVTATTTSGDKTNVSPPNGIYAPIATVAAPSLMHQTSTHRIQPKQQSSQSHCEERASHSEGGARSNSPATSSSTHTTASHAH